MKIYDVATAEKYDNVLGYNTPFGEYKLSMIAEQISEFSSVDSTKSILELASGTGELAIRLTEKSNEVICSDLSKHMVNISKRKTENLQIRNMKFVVADALRLPFKDNVFDIVMERGISLLVYDKFLEDGTAKNVLEEMKRVSKDKVVIIHSNKYPLLFFDQKRTQYHYYYGKNLRKLLESVCLDNVKVTYITHSMPLLFNLFGEKKLKKFEKIIRSIPFIKIFGGGIIAIGKKN